MFSDFFFISHHFRYEFRQHEHSPVSRWLLEKPVKPLQPQLLKNLRRTLEITRDHIKAAANTHNYGNAKRCFVLGNPRLLCINRTGNEHKIRMSRPYVLDDFGIFIRSEITITIACYRNARILLLQLLCGLLDNFLRCTEQENAPAALLLLPPLNGGASQSQQHAL